MTFQKSSTGTSALKFSVKLLPANMGFVNYSGLKFSQIFRIQRSFLEVFYKSSCSALINAVRKYLNFHSNSSKLVSLTCKLTECHNPSQVFFEEFHYKCRTVILKNASRWLLLATILFSKYSSMAATQRQLQRYIYFRNSGLHIITFLTLTSC